MSAYDASQWLEQYGDTLYRYALKRVRDESLAEDLVQETLLAALKARDDYQRRSSVKTWLVGILKHKIVDHIRKACREVPLNEDVDISADLKDRYFDERGHWQSDVGAWAAPEKSLENMQFWRVLQECIDNLPERMATLFILREVDGLATEEICKVMEVSSTNNVWVMLSRIRMRMRQCLETNWFQATDEESG